MTKQAIIYTRFSPRPNAKECDSCEKQEERCLAYCKQCGYNVITINGFRDEAISGGILNRPGLQEAINILEPNWVLVVDSCDRLARDPAIAYAILAQIEATGAIVEYANGQPMSSSPEGKLIQGVFILLAAYQRDCIKLNTKRGTARNRALGKKINGRIPTGMKEDPENPGMLVKCDIERKAILLVCRWKNSRTGYSFREMAGYLDAIVGLYRGKSWSGRLVQKIIARHSYWADPVDGGANREPEFF